MMPRQHNRNIMENFINPFDFAALNTHEIIIDYFNSTHTVDIYLLENRIGASNYSICSTHLIPSSLLRIESIGFSLLPVPVLRFMSGKRNGSLFQIRNPATETKKHRSMPQQKSPQGKPGQASFPSSLSKRHHFHFKVASIRFFAGQKNPVAVSIYLYQFAAFSQHERIYFAPRRRIS